MRLDWRLEAPQLALIAAMWIASATAWNALPEAIPVHWNIYGQVDRYGSKAEGLLLTPALAAGLYLLLVVLPRFDPRRTAYAQFAGAYAAIRIAVLAVLAAIHGALLASAGGVAVDMMRLVPILMGGLFITIGLAMGRVQPNWFVGVRTPWTLSSPASWEKTHRASVRVFVALGLAFLLTAVVSSPVAILAAVAGTLVGVLGLVVYSYLVWRADPQRGTDPS